MDFIVTCSDFIKVVFTTQFIYFAYLKIVNYNTKNLHKTIFIILVSIFIATCYIILIRLMPPLVAIVLLYFVYGFIIKNTIEKDGVKYNIITYISSCVIAYAIYLVAVMISGVITFLILQKREYTDPINLLTIPIILGLLFLVIFKMKRLKNGINFLKNRANKNINAIEIFLFCLIILIFGISKRTNNVTLSSFIFISSMLIAFGIGFWIKTQITKTYKNKMRDRTIEIQKTEIDEQTKLIEEVKAENLKLATAIHKYNHKFESLEHAMKSALNLDSKTEFANEISAILKESEETLKNFAKEVEVNTNKLPLTNIAGIDKMFKYMQEEAIKNNINFDLKINESIKPLVENTIPKEKFEILIGDHLKDAIIAIKASKATYKSILVTLGLVEGIYEFSIYDTGIEFEIDTLLKLGQEQVTTHKNEGGSGIGFMTTFETLKECKASLVIEEYNPETTNYTKSVTIKFDGRNEYKICSYRAEKIKEQKSKRRIIIEKMK